MLLSLLLLLAAGGMNGSFAIPMKLVRGWQWERTWLAWSFLAMLVIPVAVAAGTVPQLASVYRGAGFHPLFFTALFGMVWGFGTVLFGWGITQVGVALSFGIVLGSSSLFGAILPLVMLHRERLVSSGNLISGAGVIVAGVAACSWAGQLRERGSIQVAGGPFAAGLAICLLSGLGSACMNLALNAAAPIIQVAESMGISPAVSLNAVWPILLGGGFVVNAVYCPFRLIRSGNSPRVKVPIGANMILVVLMAVLWSGSNFVYGIGARAMGSLGLILGWPVFMAAIVLTANLWGWLAGEWHNSGRRAITWEAAGSLLLIAGISLIALGGPA